MKINDSDQYIIRLAKVTVNGEFSHWDVEAGWTELDGNMGGTSPTAAGAIDMAVEYMYDNTDNGMNPGWALDNANDH